MQFLATVNMPVDATSMCQRKVGHTAHAAIVLVMQEEGETNSSFSCRVEAYLCEWERRS